MMNQQLIKYALELEYVVLWDKKVLIKRGTFVLKPLKQFLQFKGFAFMTTWGSRAAGARYKCTVDVVKEEHSLRRINNPYTDVIPNDLTANTLQLDQSPSISPTSRLIDDKHKRSTSVEADPEFADVTSWRAIIPPVAYALERCDFLITLLRCDVSLFLLLGRSRCVLLLEVLWGGVTVREELMRGTNMSWSKFTRSVGILFSSSSRVTTKAFSGPEKRDKYKIRKKMLCV